MLFARPGCRLTGHFKDGRIATPEEPTGDETDIGCVNPFDWPDDQGMFPDFSYLADSTEGTGWDYDDIMPDFDGVDQYGNDFNLYQYYGYVIILDLSAGWCGPCKTVASRAEGHYQDHRLDGFTVIHAMVDDYSYGGGFSDTFLAEWAEDYELTFPVINDPEDAASSGLGGSGVYEGYIPFMVLLDRDMRIDSGYTGATADGQAVARAMELIGE